MSAKPTATAPPIYTKTGDDGTTGLLFGGRVSKADAVIETCGTPDEAVAALGLGRAILEDHSLRRSCSTSSAACSLRQPRSPPTRVRTTDWFRASHR